MGWDGGVRGLTEVCVYIVGSPDVADAVGQSDSSNSSRREVVNEGWD